MFNLSKFSFYDGYGLTRSVIDGEKTQKRVVVEYKEDEKGEWVKKPPMYKVGDEVILIQPYKDIPGLEGKGLERRKGWRNKMFVRLEYMPYKVRVKNVREERLHKITESEALAEGVKKYECEGLPAAYTFEGNDSLQMYATAREAFIMMCDGLFGKDSWKRNPDVYVYEFEIIKN